jgi:hypothetical protein
MNGDKFLKPERLPNFNVNQSDCIIFVGKLSILLGKGVRHIANHSKKDKSKKFISRQLLPDIHLHKRVSRQSLLCLEK